MVQNFSIIITVFNIDDLPVSIKQLKTEEASNYTEIGWRNYCFWAIVSDHMMAIKGPGQSPTGSS